MLKDPFGRQLPERLEYPTGAPAFFEYTREHLTGLGVEEVTWDVWRRKKGAV